VEVCSPYSELRYYLKVSGQGYGQAASGLGQEPIIGRCLGWGRTGRFGAETHLSICRGQTTILWI